MPAGPSIPPTPGLFSTMMGCPKCLDASSASLRRCVSVEPPAGHGTMSVIGRVGKSCASAAGAIAPNTASAAKAIAGVLFIRFPLGGLLLLGLYSGDCDDPGPLRHLLFRGERPRFRRGTHRVA